QAELYRADDRATIESGEPKLAFEEPQTTPDGRIIWLQTSKIPLRNTDGQIFGVLGTYEDITPRKEAEEKLVIATEAAQQANKAKSEFFTNMSHEIRTLLNAVLGLAKIGLRDTADNQSRGSFQNILNSGQHLLTIVNDILDFSKLETGKFSVESRPFQLVSTVEDAINIMTDRASEKGLKLSIKLSDTLPAYTLGDPLRLQQILLNLLSNAVKFSTQGEIIVCVSRKDRFTYISVQDQGIGLNEEQISRLFIPFEQADKSTTRKYGGSGLGLAISYNLAQLMGGNISVESQIHTGSTFTLKLPLAESQSSDIQKTVIEDKSGPQLQGLRILVAEDIEINRLIIEDLLEHEGASVMFAEDGQQAIDHLHQEGVESIDIVLMDIQMPIMGDYEATRHILKIAPELPIIGVTAHALKEEHDKCFAAGMVDHITKPIEENVLITAILKYVK
ncbi:MAG: response regulator, partial [Gammaproteobacteria bacterium]|nr:response regulator [Gammaproteobacteria bacterium]